MNLARIAFVQESRGFPQLGTAHYGIIAQEQAFIGDQFRDRHELHFGDQVPDFLILGHKKLLDQVGVYLMKGRPNGTLA